MPRTPVRNARVILTGTRRRRGRPGSHAPACLDHGAEIFEPLYVAMRDRGVAVEIYLKVERAPNPCDVAAYIAHEVATFLRQELAIRHAAPCPLRLSAYRRSSDEQTACTRSASSSTSASPSWAPRISPIVVIRGTSRSALASRMPRSRAALVGQVRAATAAGCSCSSATWLARTRGDLEDTSNLFLVLGEARRVSRRVFGGRAALY